MPDNMFQIAARWLGDGCKVAAGRVVTYRQGILSTSLTMWPERVDRQSYGDEGLLTSSDNFSWRYKAEDLVIGGSQVIPRAGDQITETLNGQVRVYEVMPLTDDGEPIEWADSAEILRTVHCKRVE